MGEIERAALVAQLYAANPLRLAECAQYADVVIEYRVATANIEEHGLVVQHPRTLNPMVNPYIAIRNDALRKMQTFKVLKVDDVWIVES